MWLHPRLRLPLLLFGLLLAPASGAAQGIDWAYTDLTTDTHQTGSYPYLVADAQGGLHLTCWDEARDRLLYGYRHPDSATFAYQVVDPANNGGYRSTIHLDAQGRPHLAYFANVNDQMRVRYATLQGGQWQVTAVSEDNFGLYGPLAASGNGYIQASLDLDQFADGTPYLVFFHGQYNKPNNDFGLELYHTWPNAQGQWQTASLGNLPVYDPTHPAVIFDEGIAGVRYGEFCRIVNQPGDSAFSLLCVAKVNSEVFRFDTQADSFPRYQLTVLDSSQRHTGVYWVDPVANPGAYGRYVRHRLELTFTGLDALRTPDGRLHLSYGLDDGYGRSINYSFAWSVNYMGVDTDGTTHPVEILPGTPPDFLNRSYTSLAHRGNDTLLMSFGELETDAYRLAYSANAGSTWAVRHLAAASAPRQPASLALAQDSLYAAYYRPEKAALHLATMPVANPATAAIDTQPLRFSERRGHALAADWRPATSPGGTLTLATVDADGLNQRVFYRWKTDTGWAQVRIDTGSEALHLALAHKADGSPAVLMADATLNALRLLTPQTANPAGPWQSETVDPLRTGDDAQLAIRGDSLHLAYHDPLFGTLRYGFRTGAQSWSLEVVDGSADTARGAHLSLKLDALGQVHLVYQDRDDEAIRYALRDNQGRWSRETIPFHDTMRVGQGTSLALTANGQPVVATRNATLNALALAWRQPGLGWQLQDSLPTGHGLAQIGQPVRLLLDSADRPFVAYNLATNLASVQVMAKRNSLQDSVWLPLPVSNNAGQLGTRFAFLRQGARLVLVGQKQAPANTGLAMLSAENGTRTNQLPNAAPTAPSLSLSLFPNPATTQATLQYHLPTTGWVRLALADAAGRLAWQATPRYQPAGPQHWAVDLAAFPPGAYVCSLSWPGGQVARRLIVTP